MSNANKKGDVDQPAPVSPKWVNRIVGHGIKAADQFTHHPNNPKFHPITQRETLKALIDSVGMIAPVIENVRTG